MENKNVLVGVANKGEQSMKIEDIKDWNPEKVSFIGTTTYFKDENGDVFYSMDRNEFNNIFGHKLNK